MCASKNYIKLNEAGNSNSETITDEKIEDSFFNAASFVSKSACDKEDGSTKSVSCTGGITIVFLQNRKK